MSTPTSGLDLSQRDPSIRIQDDLFGHVNGAWLAAHEIAEDKSGDSEFTRLRDLSEERVHALAQRLAADQADRGTIESDADKVGALFTQFMDEDAANRAGAEPLEEFVGRILAADSRSALTEVAARPESATAVIAVGVWHDADDSSRNQAQVFQSGLGLPDESFYRQEQYAPIVEAYTDVLARFADLSSLPGRAGLPDGDARALAETVVDLEKRIAAHHVDVVRLRDREKSTNRMDADQRAAAFPAFDWDAHFSGLGVDLAELSDVNVGQPEYLQGVSTLWADEPLENLRAWLALHFVVASAPYLSDEFVAAHHEFFGTTLTGVPQLKERWKRGVAFVEDALGEAIGEMYVAEHFPPEAKQRMEELVDALIDAYRRSITDLEWMTPATREKALEKLTQFTPKIGYPATWRRYDELEIDDRSLLHQRLAVARHEHAHQMAKLAQPVDPDEWHMTPQTVNAYYNPGANEIVFPAAILQAPYFDMDADDAVNFGGIGAVIGHEIGHGFDDQGSKYDGRGNLRSWWTEEDRTEFENRTRALIDDYSAMSPRDLDDEHTVNGAFTIGENIGDLGGLSIALDAYRHLAGDTADETGADGFTGIQRVFLAWAVIWRAKYREAEAIRRLAIDPHSPAEFRTNGVVRHMDEFHDAFGVTESDSLFLAPEKRVSIW
ncbi:MULTISPECIES: M13 family metallopeptidase [Helcobacillus]|uniref:Putative endopeptidase n=1 Tax=Helcobacillus massiliensis TaxID=521392 RepID=A0A839QSV0_9MICO|nr:MULTISPECIES: M13-type metalloendopeptidase [Helcobacillus]MBB3022728.1 putative endopeptidase [Helcobacillus massiliensis]MCG7426339.1 peptidase M13 [Helcobacillus sp. ACRRO]